MRRWGSTGVVTAPSWQGRRSAGLVIGGATRLVGLLGQPVSGSLSPRMQNAAFAARALDWAYVALDVVPEQLETALRGLVALDDRRLGDDAEREAAIVQEQLENPPAHRGTPGRPRRSGRAASSTAI